MPIETARATDQSTARDRPCHRPEQSLSVALDRLSHRPEHRPSVALDRLFHSQLTALHPVGQDGAVTHYEDSLVEVHRVVVGPMDNNVHVVRCRQSGEAVLIDAANEHERLLDLCRTLGVRRVVETHGHWDHIQAVPAVRDAGLDVAVTAADAGMLPAYDQILEDDQILAVGRLRIRTIATPGHTPGSICFAVEGTPLLFSGDTLFPGGPGNTSFPGGDFAAIIDSLDRRLFAAFDDTTLVLPGHGADTTIGAERPHLAEWAARGW
ncbi:MAG: MBL fold metallo-hydrolase [Actinomycetota bacterium]|nr:MBL fold metallo-hydrolase [Actinomycetota bacterium]